MFSWTLEAGDMFLSLVCNWLIGPSEVVDGDGIGKSRNVREYSTPDLTSKHHSPGEVELWRWDGCWNLKMAHRLLGRS